MPLTKEQLIQEMLSSVNLTEAFTPQDIAWCDYILRRTDGQNGVDQLRPLIMQCEDFLDRKDALLKKELETGRSQKIRIELEKEQLNQALFTAKSLYYKQKKIMIACATRKRHPTHIAPNLAGFIANQQYRVEIEVCHGLGYAESRNYLYTKAKEMNATHILYVDDDVLIPLNALDILVSANEMAIGANYYKRNPLNESVVTTIGNDKQVLFHNMIVDAKQGDMTPVTVNAMGLGATLINMEIFKTLPDPPFSFVYEILPNGQRSRVLVGEDSHLVQQMLMRGLKPKIIPGLCCVHVDLKTGAHFGPDWLVKDGKLRPELKDKYTYFACNPQELYAKDLSNEFGGM